MQGEEQPEELMLLYQQGDGSVLPRLYRQVAPAMFTYLYRLCRDRALAEDLLQEVFLRVHKVRHTYRPGSSVKPWLYAIARYTAIDALRKRDRRREVAYEEGSRAGDRVPAEEAGCSEQMEEVEQAMDLLPGGQREALLLTKVSGLSVKEAAAAMGCSEGAVKVKVHRALQALRTALGRHTSKHRAGVSGV
ncbi:MAG: RNA polymerase sigma factor [bacterium]